MTFEDWFTDRIGMSTDDFRRWTATTYGYHHDNPDAIIRIYRGKFMDEMDRYALDSLDLTFEEFLQGYYHLTPASFHNLCEATGTSAKEERKAFEWFQRRYRQHQDNLSLTEQCPFKN